MIVADKYSTEEKKDIHNALEAFTRCFNKDLNNNLFAKKYMQKRGISIEYINAKEISFIPLQGTYLCPPEEQKILQKLGLLDKVNINKVAYKWGNRIFVCFRIEGIICYFAGRALDSNSKYKQMLPSVDEMGNKRVLDSSKGDSVLIVEGLFDFFSIDQMGISVIGILGKSPKFKLANKIKVVTLGFDWDSSGLEFIIKHGIDFWEQGKEVYVLTKPKGFLGNDINDYIVADGNFDDLEKVLLESFIIEKMNDDFEKFGEFIFQRLSNLSPNKVNKYLNEIKKVTKTNKGVLEKELQRYLKKPLKNNNTAIEDNSWIDISGNFDVVAFGDHIIRKYNLKYWKGDIYSYVDGYYISNDNDFIDYILVNNLGKNYKLSLFKALKTFVVSQVKGAKVNMNDKPNLINFKNGVLNILDPELKIILHDPKYLSTIRIPVDYNRSALCPAFDKFLIETLPPDCIDLIFEIIGHSLIIDNLFGKAIILIGGTTTGKSTIIKVITKLLGEANISNVSLQDLESSKFRASCIVGKLINTFSDLPASAIKDDSIFKNLVSGDKITFEKKFGHPFSWENKTKLLFSTNKLPPHEDPHPAFFRRLILVPFRNSFLGKEDPGLLEKLTTPEELSGIINKALKGLFRLFKNEKYSESASTQKEMNFYKRTVDNEVAFIKSIGAEPQKDKFESKASVFKAYWNWCNKNKKIGLSSTKFAKKFEKLIGIREKRKNNIHGWEIDCTVKIK